MVLTTGTGFIENTEGTKNSSGASSEDTTAYFSPLTIILVPGSSDRALVVSEGITTPPPKACNVCQQYR